MLAISVNSLFNIPMQENFEASQEKEPGYLYSQAEHWIEERRNKIAAMYGTKAIRPDYFRGYEVSGYDISDEVIMYIEQTTFRIRDGKRTYYELVVSSRDGGAFDPSQYVEVDETDGNTKFVALKFTLHSDRIYAEGRHDYESEPVLLGTNEFTVKRIMDLRLLSHAIHGTYLAPGEELPPELDSWNRRI